MIARRDRFPNPRMDSCACQRPNGDRVHCDAGVRNARERLSKICRVFSSRAEVLLDPGIVCRGGTTWNVSSTLQDKYIELCGEPVKLCCPGRHVWPSLAAGRIDGVNEQADASLRVAFDDALCEQRRIHMLRD